MTEKYNGIYNNPPRYIVGCDLGQAQDFTGIVVMRPDDAEPPTYTAGHIERLPLNTRYPRVVSYLGELIAALRTLTILEVASTMNGLSLLTKQADVALVVDYTGVGRPVADMIVDADFDCDLLLVTITGGDSVTDGPMGEKRVPKRDLASSVQRLLQEERLIMPAAMPWVDVLTKELTGFRVKINLRGHDSYGAGEDWRSAAHDDLVLSLALAAWYGEHWQTANVW